MDITGKTIWQVAAGDADRNHADLCLYWNVILNGPGADGPWPDCVETLRSHWGLSTRKITDLKRFCEEIKDGDLVVLRLGTTDVLGVGIIVGDYQWHEEFGDIDGWDLQHIRRVKWLWQYDGIPKKFPAYTLKFGDTVQTMDCKEVCEWIADLEVYDDVQESSLKDLPQLSRHSSWNEISEYLFDYGVASSAIKNLTEQIDELIFISKWYHRTGNPSETETTAYLVIPLLRSLGWTPQKMAMEWCSVDVALFNTLPRHDENLSVVVEVKQQGRSCFNAQSQAQSYAQQSGRESCGRLIVTDGLRYGIYLRNKDNGFEKKPDAYLNLLNMRNEYPVLGCKGAKDAFLFMSADWTQ
ncbi:MAG: hypothetical protein K9L17_08940 [Clostridiales bacterium]|nr:hypothetical protein [Clostridiales bacterium]MCF8022803.1 hypothetical protein [Clostridiales bacterium]